MERVSVLVKRRETSLSTGELLSLAWDIDNTVSPLLGALKLHKYYVIEIRNCQSSQGITWVTELIQMHVLLRRAEKNMVSMIFYDGLRQGANAVQLL